jgi:hypothetical protein
MLSAADDRVAVGNLSDLRGYWPPLLCFVNRSSSEQLSDLDADLDLVIQRSPANIAMQQPSFLTANADDKPNTWSGGMFDIATKAIALRLIEDTSIDVSLPNGRRCDIKMMLNGRPFFLEATVIGEDDESREVAERARANQGDNEYLSYIRPGKYCPENAKGPSPYYDVLRVYGKVFDKLAPDLDLTRSQLRENSPNVLLLSFAHAPLRSDSPGVGWAFDELFVTHPRLKSIIPDGFKDVTLSGWINYKADELRQKGQLTVDVITARMDDAFAALRRLSGILLFDGCRLRGARVNYNADEACRVSHAEITQLEQLFSRSSSYFPA